MDPLAPDEIKIERLDDEEEEEDQLMIDDEDSDLIDENNIEDPTDDTNDDQVRLEKLTLRNGCKNSSNNSWTKAHKCRERKPNKN